MRKVVQVQPHGDVNQGPVQVGNLQEGFLQQRVHANPNRPMLEEFIFWILWVGVRQPLHDVDNGYPFRLQQSRRQRSPVHPSYEEHVGAGWRPGIGDRRLTALPPGIAFVQDRILGEVHTRTIKRRSFDVIEVMPDLEMTTREPAERSVEKHGLFFRLTHPALTSESAVPGLDHRFRARSRGATFASCCLKWRWGLIRFRYSLKFPVRS